MVKPNNDAVFVYWRNIITREGRVVSLDAHNGIKTLVFFAVKLEKFTDAFISIPRTGGVMMRARGKERPRMPDWAVEARFYESLRHFSGPFPATLLPDGNRVCAACHAACAFGVDQYSAVVDKDLWVCRGCLTSWHLACASMNCLAEHYIDWSGRPTDGQFRCPFCRRE